MTSAALVVPPEALVGAVFALSPRQRATSYASTVVAMSRAEVNRARRERSVLAARAAQPLLWLLVFGAAVSRVRELGAEGVPYKASWSPAS